MHFYRLYIFLIFIYYLVKTVVIFETYIEEKIIKDFFKVRVVQLIIRIKTINIFKVSSKLFY
jgi:hypothetical protein